MKKVKCGDDKELYVKKNKSKTGQRRRGEKSKGQTERTKKQTANGRLKPGDIDRLVRYKQSERSK